MRELLKGVVAATTASFLVLKSSNSTVKEATCNSVSFGLYSGIEPRRLINLSRYLKIGSLA